MAQRDGLIVPMLPVLDLTSGNDATGKPVPPSVGGNNQKWATQGYFGRLNYDYKGKYLLEANLRYDGSSRFRSDMRWLYSPSVSAGWVLSEEAFLQNISAINSLKLRASWGLNGNDRIGSFGYLATLTSTDREYYSVVATQICGDFAGQAR